MEKEEKGIEVQITEGFACKNCGEVTHKSDYHERETIYNSLKESELCETCARLSEEERKEYAMGKRLVKAMVKRRREVIDKDIARLTAERTAVDSMSPKELALEVLKEKSKEEQE